MTNNVPLLKVLFVFIVLVDVGCHTAETSLALTDSTTRNQSSSHLISIYPEKSKLNFISLNTLKELLHFLNSISPLHQSILFFDLTFQEMANYLMQHYGKAANSAVLDSVTGTDIGESLLSAKLALGSTKRRHILVLCSLENVEKIFNMISSKNLESRWTWWIILTAEKNVASNLEGILREGSQVVLIVLEEPNRLNLLSSRVDVKGLVRLQEAGMLTMTPKGYNSKILLDVFENLDESYSNFQGRQLTFTANNNHPFILFEKLSDGELLPIAGFEYSIVKALGGALNFTSRLIAPADGKWGGPLPNGTVVGMIGVVARREAQFALCEISLTGVREEVIDFTYPHYIESLTLLSRAPMERNRTFAAFAPFTPLVWLLISISILLIGPIIKAESWVVNKYLPTADNAKNISDAMFNMFRSLVKQENLMGNESSPQKLTIFFWYIFCFIISVLYSGMLTATLIKPSYEKPINGLTDLPAAVKEDFTLVVTADTSMEYMFKDAKSGIYADTWKLFNHKDRSKSFVRYSIESFDKIVKDKLVIINGQLTSRYHGAKLGSSQFYLARDTFAPQYYGAPCYPGSPFLPVFNKMLSYMTEGGLITKWVENEFRQVATQNSIIQKSGPRAFTVKHLQAAFYVLPIGFVLSAVAFAIEVISLYPKAS